MKTRTKQTLRYVVLLSVFALMCVLRLWFTLFLVLIFGLVLTLTARRRVFCSAYCPMGTVQDAFYKKESSRKGRLFDLLSRRGTRIVFSLLFWGYIGIAVLLFRDRPDALWTALLALMLGSGAVALIVQAFSTKRAWCSTICPYGNVYASLVGNPVKKR